MKTIRFARNTKHDWTDAQKAVIARATTITRATRRPPGGVCCDSTTGEIVTAFTSNEYELVACEVEDEEKA